MSTNSVAVSVKKVLIKKYLIDVTNEPTGGPQIIWACLEYE